MVVVFIVFDRCLIGILVALLVLSDLSRSFLQCQMNVNIAPSNKPRLLLSRSLHFVPCLLARRQ
jgi:hypothetical protein